MEPLNLDYRRFPVLVVDDEENNLEVFRLQFRRAFDVTVAHSAKEALELIRPGEWEPAVVVSDQRMPGLTGIDLLKQVAERCPDAVGIILTAFSDWDVLLEALHSGSVYRYLTKPWKKAEMEITLRQAIERFALTQENRRMARQLSRMNEYLEDELKASEGPERIIGERGGLAELMGLVARVAGSPTTVLLRGESGTGKEVIARALHDQSPRAQRPFIKVSCAALSPGVLESELFGHEKGAFTGAVGQRLGRFELAHRGTIFLDEVGDMSLELQVKLLRVLQERELERVGGTRTIQVDARVIAATHRDLEGLIQEGRFRQDLYYRLNVCPLFLPPLRQRREDIPALVEHFVDRFSRRAGRPLKPVTPEAMQRLSQYAWPGNVRELQNVVERAVALSRGSCLDVEAFSYGWKAFAAPLAGSPEEGGAGPEGELAGGGSPRGEEGSSRATRLEAGSAPASGGAKLEGSGAAAGGESLDGVLADLERQQIVGALKRARGKKAEAARELGLSRTTLYYRMKRLGIDDNEGES